MTAPKEWFERLRMGEFNAFRRFVDETKNLVYYIIGIHMNDRHKMEDLAQETYLKAYSSIRMLRNPGSIRSWISTIARNTTVDWIRKKNVRPDEVSINPSHAVTAEKTDDGNRKEIIRKVLTRLSPKDQEIIYLRYYRKASFSEIADELRTTPGAIRTRVSRIHSKIERSLRFHMEDLV